MTFSTTDGYKGPLENLSCVLQSSSVFDFKHPNVDIATNLCWDRDISWIRNGSTIILCYAGEYVDHVMLDKIDKLGQEVIVVSPLNYDHSHIPYSNIIFHHIDFLHYDSLYYKDEPFVKEKLHKYSCMNRRVADWKYITLGYLVSLFGDDLKYTNINDDRIYYQSYLENLSEKIWKN